MFIQIVQCMVVDLEFFFHLFSNSSRVVSLKFEYNEKKLCIQFYGV